MQENDIKQIKELIKSGFDIELISFEFDIPIQELEKFKEELINDNKKEYNEEKNNKKTNYSNMEQIRRNYKKLFCKNNMTEIKKPKELSEKENQIVETAITVIKDKIQEMANLTNKEKRNVASQILSELQKIENYNLTIEQSEKLNNLMQSDELDNLKVNAMDSIDKSMHKAKVRVAKKLANAVENEHYSTEDVEILNELQKKLTLEMAQNNPLSIGLVKSTINAKIRAIQERKVINSIKNDIPISMVNVIFDLVDGEININEADNIIEEEARKKVQDKKQTKFSLTIEQERERLLFAIKTQIMEKPNKYYIINPEQTISQMQQLSGMETNQAIRTVVKNLIAAKRFENAKNICDKFSSKDVEEKIRNYILPLKREIRNAEISDLVLKGINMEGTLEQENAYFKLIEEGLRRGNVKPQAVSLGKSEDGLRNISLADVWIDNKEIIR